MERMRWTRYLSLDHMAQLCWNNFNYYCHY